MYRLRHHHLLLAACLLTWLCATASTAQELTFEFQVTVNGHASAWHTFGLREQALPGNDSYDLPEPPPTPGTPFLAYLAMFDANPGLPNRWLSDFRPIDSLAIDHIELWQVNIESVPVGTTCRIDVRTPSPINLPYDLYFFGPGVCYTPVRAPASVFVTATASPMVQFFELRLDESVPAVRSSWGDVKGLFR